MKQATDTPTPDRLWRWFARIFNLKTGLIPVRGDNWHEECFNWWLSGYECRKLDEESMRNKEGVLTHG